MATIHGIEFKKVTFHDIYPDDRFSLSFDIDQYFAVAAKILRSRRKQIHMDKIKIKVCMRLLSMASLRTTIKVLKHCRRIIFTIAEWDQCCWEVEQRMPVGRSLAQAKAEHQDLPMWLNARDRVEAAMYPILNALPERMLKEYDYVLDWKPRMPIEVHTNFRDMARGMFSRFHFMFHYCQATSINMMQAILRKARALLSADSGPFDGDALILQMCIMREQIPNPSDEIAVFLRVVEYVERPERRQAFGMALIPRLGAYSLAGALQPELIHAIAQQII